jgi:hypothetical protein
MAGVLTALGVFAMPTVWPQRHWYTHRVWFRYVAVADDIPSEHDVEESERYPNHLSKIT